MIHRLIQTYLFLLSLFTVGFVDQALNHDKFVVEAIIIAVILIISLAVLFYRICRKLS